MRPEIVYLGRDNSIDLELLSNGDPADLSSITRMDLQVGEITISSDDPSSGPIRWAQPGYATGEVRLSLGDSALTPMASVQTGTLVVFDAANPDGIVWGEIRLLVKSGI